MTVRARFAHVNIVARDWRALARFYEQVFGCTPVPPERSLSGPWLDSAIGLEAARIRGIHLRLPGYGDDGPTLEIFQYDEMESGSKTAINRPGLTHLAFAVDDVKAALGALLAAGGGTVGEITTVEVAGVSTITFVYATDPEGNILELQRWS